MVENQERDLARLLESDSYNAAISWHTNRGRKVTPLDPKVELMLAMKALSASGCSVEELHAVLRENVEAFNTYASARLDLYQGDTEEEYPSGETPPKDERSKTLSIGNYPRIFLVSPLIEFVLLTSRPDELELFAKRYRIPNAKRHSKAILALFSRLKK